MSKKEEIIFDSNVWIAFFSQDDSCHYQANDIFKKYTKFTIPEYVILETSTILKIRKNKSLANNFIKKIISDDSINILTMSDSFFIDVMNSFIESSDSKLSFIDHSLLCLSKNYKIITFDKDLEKLINQSS